MAGLSSQLGNRYCYYVGAYLKTSKFTFFESKELVLKEYDIMVDSIEIPAENSTFDQKLSLDLLASTTNSEYWGECKWSGSPRKISKNSDEFIETLLEFMGLERYRLKTTWKHIEYLFITSHFIDRLNLEVNRLRTEPSSEIKKYIEIIKKKASKKWTKINLENINEILLRRVLNRMLILPLSSDRLDEVRINPEFQSELKKLHYKNLVRDISIPFPPISDIMITALMYEDTDDNFYNLTLLGYKFSISKRIITEIKSYLLDIVTIDTIIELDESKLPFLSSFIFTSPSDFSFLLRQLLNESMNVLLLNEYNNQKIIIIFNPDLRIIYVINIKWLLKIASKHVTSLNTYKLDEITKSVGTNISKKVLELSIIEAKRQKGIIIDRDIFEK